MKPDSLEYYRSHGRMTDPREEAGMFEDLPQDVAALRSLIQGLLVHVFWAQRYGLALQKDRERELQVRSVAEKLKQIRRLDDSPLAVPRPLEKRLVGNCRDFSPMLCSMLRHHGVPARARCGFATYFVPNHFEDHWVCECWQGTGRWVKVDAQLDAFQRDELGIDFDPLDVPDDKFLVAGKAWQLCRTGGADLDAFGIGDLHGLWFVRGNLVRDLASLNKVELLPWDSWGLIDKGKSELSVPDLALLDEVAVITQTDNDGFDETRSIYENNTCLRVPHVIRSYLKDGVQTVEIEA
jgi:hypothetical protein